MSFLRAIPYYLMVLATVVIMKKKINSYFPSPGYVAGEISLLHISMGFMVLFSA